MDWDRISGSWTEAKGRLHSAYGELTDDDLERTKGDQAQLEGLLQQKLGQTKDEARATLEKVLGNG